MRAQVELSLWFDTITHYLLFGQYFGGYFIFIGNSKYMSTFVKNKHNVMDKQRLLWLDIAKAITIILMVLGHSSLPSTISNLIYVFHMPLFFIASGLTTNWKNDRVLQFVVHKTRTIMLPFVIYSIMLLILTQFTSEPVRLIDFIEKGWVSWALWFVIVLYFALILCKIICDIRNKYVQWFCIVVLLILGITLCSLKIYLPWSMSTVPIAVTYLYLGSQFQLKPSIITLRCYRMYVPVFFVVAVIVSYFWRLDLCFNKIMPIIPLYIGSVAGTLVVFMFASFIEKYLSQVGNIFIRIGRETFIIVAFSQVIIVLANDYLTISSCTKYSLLVISLVGISVCKNFILKKISTSERWYVKSIWK